MLVLIGLLGLVAAQNQRSYALDAAMVLALLSFVSTLAGPGTSATGAFDQPDEEGPP